MTTPNPTCRSRKPPPDPSVKTSLLLQGGMWSPFRQKEVRAGERSREGRGRPCGATRSVQRCVSKVVFSLWDAPSFLFTCYSGNGTINNLSPIGWRASDLSAKLILTGQVSGQKASSAVLGNSHHHNYKINTLFSGQILSSGKRLLRFISIEHRSQITLLSRILLAVGSLHLCPQIFPFMVERRPTLGRGCWGLRSCGGIIPSYQICISMSP